MNLLNPSLESQPVLAECSRRDGVRSRHSVRRIGRVRIPLAGPYRPWATLFRLPDGRLAWCIRLWSVDRAEHRCVGTETLRQFAVLNRLPGLRAEIDALLVRAADQDG
jgi:hypothetical protein